jgi:AraC-like DNA-binding protein
VELPDLDQLVGDSDAPRADLHFPDPVLRDPGLAERFLAMHLASERGAPALERDTLLSEWFGELGARGRRPVRIAGDEPALRRGCEYLQDNLPRNVTLDELAAAAGAGRHRLIRLFREGLGLPPHRFQLAQRIKLARRLLERGEAPGEAALEAGFFDQSHMHRHFRRTLGETPGSYAAAFERGRTNVQDGGPRGG